MDRVGEGKKWSLKPAHAPAELPWPLPSGKESALGSPGRGGSPPTAQQPGRQINPAVSLPGFRSQTESLTDRGALIFVLQEFCTSLKCQPNAGWNCHNSWGMPTGFDWDSGWDIPPHRRPGPAANMAARKLRTKPGSGNISLPWPRRRQLPAWPAAARGWKESVLERRLKEPFIPAVARHRITAF